MELGFGTGFVETMNLDQSARWASEHGFRYLEINVGPVFNQRRQDILDVARVVSNGPERVLDTIASYGVSISAIAPMINLLDADPSRRQELLAYFRQIIDACAILKVPIAKTYAGSAHGMYFLGLPSVGPNHPSNKLEDNLRLFKHVFAPLAKYAEDKGVRIAFETAPRGGGWGNLALSPALWDAIFDAVPSPALGLAFDPSHLVWLRTMSPEEAVRSYGQRIYYVDGKDTVVMPERLRVEGVIGNSWWRYCVPGMGDLNWATLVAALRSVGYDYVISMENEDEVYPGKEGTEMAARFLAPLVAAAGSAREG